MAIAFSGSTWVEIVLIGSIVVPVAIASVLTWYFLRASRRDPDEERLRRVQAEYEARQRERNA
ncbi:MAG TPA: hypothetical protein VFA05_00230 [Gaiellaceae bacterium]|nr:hypothetical protein [Gaiellaceae bacterium]